MNLIYDRTKQDVETARTQRGTTLTPLKGCYNYTDMNRVELAVKTLAAALTAAGYPVEVTPVLKGKSRVPAGYTEVEWIQSSGTQYIDTGIVPGINAKISIDFDVISAGSDDVICGVIAPNICIGYSTTRIFGAFKNGTGESTGADTTVVGRHSAEISNGNFILDGTSHSFSAISSYSTTRSIYLFAGSYSGVAGGVYGKVTAKVYACKIFDGDSLVRDYIPCKNPEGTVGLYDLIGGEFYTTPTAVTLPAGYTPVEYLQSDGLQYIDTGIDVTPSNYSQLKFAVTCEKIGQGQGQSGWLVDGSNVSNAYFYIGTYNGKYYYGCGTTDHNTNISAASGKQTYVLDIPAKKFTVSGSVDTSITTEAITASASLYLFGFDYSPVRAYAEKIYASQIYNNGTLVRNFVPARNPSGALGLYDTVNDVFYTNAGTGAFTAGADIVGFTAGAETGKAEDREWQEGDVLYRPQWTTYLNNIQRLRDAYYTLAETGQLPEPGDKLGYEGANTIEKVLADIDILLDGMKSIYRRAGTFTAGGNYLRQLIRSI